MKHPLDFIRAEQRRAFFLPLLVLTLVLFAVMQALNAPLQTDAAPAGIVSFELARTTEKAFQILVSWEPIRNAGGAAIPTKWLYAAFGLGFDYLFMTAYALTIALGVLLAADKHTGWIKSLGAAAGWGVLLAAALDAVENFALWKVLLGNILSSWTQLAAVCASLKFGLIILSILYAGLAGISAGKISKA
jgi:hypothetical protein